MSTPVLMPQMGESIAEGTIVRWIKKVGDAVDRDEPLFEISTDKVDAEIPSPAAGVLAEIKVKEGETVAVNSVVATIGEPGAVEAAASEAATSPVAAPQPQPDGSPSPRSAPARPKRRPPQRWSGDAPVAVPATGWRVARRRDERAVERRAAPSEVVAAGAQDRQGARHRHPQPPGLRRRRAGDEARHPGLHRARRRRAVAAIRRASRAGACQPVTYRRSGPARRSTSRR